MNYAVLWLLSLSLLVLAPIWALTHRQQSKQARPLWLALALLLSLFGLLVGGLQVAGSFLLHYLSYETSFLSYSISWLLCFLLAMILLCARGLRTRDGRRAFSLWNSRKIGWATLIVLISYFFTLFASHKYEMASLTRMQQEAAKEIDALVSRPLLEKENAALEYQRAFKHMISTFSNENLEARWKHFLEGQDLSASAFDTRNPILLKCLEKQAPALDVLLQASQMTDCYFEHPYAQPTTDMKFPELSQFRTGAKLLAARARLHAASGNLEAAFKDLSAIDRMAEHVSREPVFLATLISIALHSISVSALEGILRTTSPGIDSLKSWVPVDIPFFDQVRKRGFTGEYAMGLHYFSQTGETESIFGMDSSALDGPAPIQITLAKIYWRVYL